MLYGAILYRSLGSEIPSLGAIVLYLKSLSHDKGSWIRSCDLQKKASPISRLLEVLATSWCLDGVWWLESSIIFWRSFEVVVTPRSLMAIKELSRDMSPFYCLTVVISPSFASPSHIAGRLAFKDSDFTSSIEFHKPLSYSRQAVLQGK